MGGNVELVRQAYAAFGRGDIPAVLGAMDPDIQWSEAEGNPYQPSGLPWSGPDAVLKNLFAKMPNDWELFRLHPTEFHHAGDTVIVELRYEARHNATGKSLDAQVCHVWRVRNGKLSRFQQYIDTAQLQDVMGARQPT